MTVYEDSMSRAERALVNVDKDGGASARRILAAIDAALFEALRRAESAPDGSAAASRRAEIKRQAFYRRRLLGRLIKSGVRPTGDHLRALFSGSGSDRLILLVTHACQLRCAYCRVRKYGATMTPDVAEAGVRWLMSSLRRDVELQFFGGEPLLALSVVRRAVALAETSARNAGKTVRFLLTTNGLALDDEAVAFLKAHRFHVEVSCDGTMSAQDAQRPTAKGGSSWARLRSGVERLRKAGVPYQVIAVLLPEDAARADERVESLAAMGHRRIQINYALGRHWTGEQADALHESMEKAALSARRLGVELVNLTVKRREPVVLNSELTVDCDGTVYRETGVCLEEDFQEMKKRFKVADVRNAGLFETYGATPFDNFAILASAYGRGGMRRTLLSNLELGRSFAEAR
ncbi:MAG: radical SAM protein [Elusimicrobia bacterium]|nr:radical SAM protein [Elusimicrobiota bacterium]